LNTFTPKYIKAQQKGWLFKKIEQSSALLVSCTLCPRECKVNRTKDEKGYCSTGRNAVVSSYAPHFGEEQQLVGDKGSGTIFFSNCNLKCIFCQNHEISITGMGQEVDDEQIASMMLQLQKIGCHNINLVTPSHVVPQILKALDIAIGYGLNIPLVYNCSGYESIDTLRILKDVIDIYMPDFKFWGRDISKICCHAQDYPQIARKAVKEMYDQVGDLKTDKSGIAYTGLIVRHLVMPGRLDDSEQILRFLKEKVFCNTHVNIMSQYSPMGDVFKIEELSRPVSVDEFRQALLMAKNFKLQIIR